MQILSAALCTIGRGLCFNLGYNARDQVVDFGCSRVQRSNVSFCP